MTTAHAEHLRTAPPRTTSRRDVVVWGTVSCAYTVTDALRAAGLSVGSWLMPTAACPARALAELDDDLTRHHIPGHWQTAPVVVTVWQTITLAHTLAPRLQHVHGGATVHVDLSSTPSPAVTPVRVHAPLWLDWARGRAYRTITATTALEDYSAVLSALTPTSQAARATSHVLHALTAHTPQSM